MMVKIGFASLCSNIMNHCAIIFGKIEDLLSGRGLCFDHSTKDFITKY